MPDSENSTDNQITVETAASIYPDERFKELIEAGVFFGRKRTKTNPRMRPYILATRNEMEIINLEKTLAGLEQALIFLKEKARGSRVVLVVGTQPQAVEGVVKLAKEFNMPFVTARWLGGLLTNFKILSKRIEYYKKLKEDLRTGGLEKYTKKERLGFERELRRLEEFFSGLENYLALPDALLVIDPNVHTTAVREAKRLNIPMIAYVNTDADPDSVEYPVVGNTKSRKSIGWFLEQVAGAIREGKAVQQVKPEESSEAMQKINPTTA